VNGGDNMKREPVMITMVVVGVLSILNITLTPEEMEALQAVIEGLILLIGGLVARSQVRPVEKPLTRKRTF
jgi:hypothetical protein